MREILNRAEERHKIDRDYIKTRKVYKAVDNNVLKLMKQFPIEKTIVESIAGSIQKLKKIEMQKQGDKWIVKDTKSHNIFLVSQVDNDPSCIWQCTCGKLKTSGLPCSHILKILEVNHIDFDHNQKLINKRWILTNESVSEAIIEKSDENPSLSLDIKHYTIKKKSKDILI